MHSSRTGRRSSPHGGTATKVLVGCGCGCLFIVLLLVLGGYAIHRTLIRPALAMAESMEAHAEQLRVARRELVHLDEVNGVRFGDDAGTAAISDEDVTRYVAVRAALAPHLERIETAEASMSAGLPADGQAGPAAMFGLLKGVMGGVSSSMTAQADLLKEAQRVLAEQSLGPTDALTLAEAVEWRLLQREEALALGVPAFRRSEVTEQRHALEWVRVGRAFPQGSERDSARLDEAEREARARLAALREEADGRRSLTDATRAVLEGRREELGGGPTAGLERLAWLTSDDIPFLSGAQGMPFGPRGQVPGGWKGAWEDDSTPPHEEGTPGEAPATDGTPL